MSPILFTDKFETDPPHRVIPSRIPSVGADADGVRDVPFLLRLANCEDQAAAEYLSVVPQLFSRISDDHPHSSAKESEIGG